MSAHPDESEGVESPKTTDRSEKAERGALTLQGSVSMDEISTFNDKNKHELSPENRRDRRTAGRGTFGECEIQTIKTCGNDKQTSVELKNGLPEKIFTHGQEWERSSNSKVWNVTEGDKNYDLKADVRLKGNDLIAKVHYENGREVTYKNGEPTAIHHPNGEIWSKDTKQEGRWNVSVPNKDDPAHPHKTTITDVQVNTADGDIKWHVDQGAAKGHDREITADKQYHDRVNGVEVSNHKLEQAVRNGSPNHQLERAPLKAEHVEQVLYKAEKPAVPHREAEKTAPHEKSAAQKLEHRSPSSSKAEHVEQVLYKAEKPAVPHREAEKTAPHEKSAAQKLEHNSASKADSESSKEHRATKNSEQKGEIKHEEKEETDPRRIGFMPDLYKYYEERATRETAERARVMSEISMAITHKNYQIPESEHPKYDARNETKNDRFAPGIGEDLHKFYAERARIETEERMRSFREVNVAIGRAFEKQGEQARRKAFAELLTNTQVVKDHVMEQVKAAAPKVMANAMSIPPFDRNTDSNHAGGKNQLLSRQSIDNGASSDHATPHVHRGALLNRLASPHEENTESAPHANRPGVLLKHLQESKAASRTDENHNASEVKNTNSIWEAGKNMLKTNWHTQSHINNGSEAHVRSSYNGRILERVPQSYISQGGDNSHPNAYQARPRELPHYNSSNDVNTNSMLRAASNMFVVNKSFVNYASSRTDGGGFKTYNGQALHRVPTSYISRRIH